MMFLKEIWAAMVFFWGLTSSTYFAFAVLFDVGVARWFLIAGQITAVISAAVLYFVYMKEKE